MCVVCRGNGACVQCVGEMEHVCAVCRGNGAYVCRV